MTITPRIEGISKGKTKRTIISVFGSFTFHIEHQMYYLEIIKYLICCHIEYVTYNSVYLDEYH